MIMQDLNRFSEPFFGDLDLATIDFLDDGKTSDQ
jgi:hypothetical protein|tara:strand:+ start:12520 stop:12621 length:102 start_codon:yes stop_codon:yes gene_type:complete